MPISTPQESGGSEGGGIDFTPGNMALPGRVSTEKIAASRRFALKLAVGAAGAWLTGVAGGGGRGMAAENDSGRRRPQSPWWFEWTDRLGRSLEAELVMVRGERALVRLANGRQAELDHGRLIPLHQRRLEFFQVRGRVEELPQPEAIAREREEVGLQSLIYRRYPEGLRFSPQLTRNEPNWYQQWHAEPELRFLLHVPPEADRAAGGLPLILFLHGTGGRGSDNWASFTDAGRAPLNMMGEDFQRWLPSYVMIPQSRSQNCWSTTSASLPQVELMLAVQAIDVLRAGAHPGIDLRRLFVTGLSGGGVGAYEAMTKFPGKFAASVPIACSYAADRFGPGMAAPTWLFYNRADGSVNRGHVTDLRTRFRELGVEHRVTEFDAGGHNAWSATYGNHEFRRWLQRQRQAVLRYPSEPEAWMDRPGEAG